MDISLFRATPSTVHLPRLGEVRVHPWRPGIYHLLLARMPKGALPRRVLRMALEALIERPKRPLEVHRVRLRSLSNVDREAIAQQLCNHCRFDTKRRCGRTWMHHFSVLVKRELRRHRRMRRAGARRFERRAREMFRDPLEQLMGPSARSLFRQFEQMDRLTNPLRYFQLDSLERFREATSAASALTEQVRAATNGLSGMSEITRSFIDRHAAVEFLTDRSSALAQFLGETNPLIEQINTTLESTFQLGIREQFNFGLTELTLARSALADLQTSPLHDFLEEQNRELQRMFEAGPFGPSVALGLSGQLRALADYDFILAREYGVPEPPRLALEYLELMKGTVESHLTSIREITSRLERLGVEWDIDDDLETVHSDHPIEDLDEAAGGHRDDWETMEAVRVGLADLESTAAFQASKRLVTRIVTLFEVLEAGGRNSEIRYSATIAHAIHRLNDIVASDSDSFRDFALCAYQLIGETPPLDVCRRISEHSRRSRMNAFRFLNELRGAVHNPARDPARADAVSKSRGKAFRALSGVSHPTNVDQWARAQRALADLLRELIDQVIDSIRDTAL